MNLVLLLLLLLMPAQLAERVLTVPEAAKLLRIGTRSYYAAAQRGEVPAVRVGRRLLVPGVQLERLLAGRPK